MRFNCTAVETSAEHSKLLNSLLTATLALHILLALFLILDFFLLYFTEGFLFVECPKALLPILGWNAYMQRELLCVGHPSTLRIISNLLSGLIIIGRVLTLRLGISAASTSSCRFVLD